MQVNSYFAKNVFSENIGIPDDINNLLIETAEKEVLNDSGAPDPAKKQVDNPAKASVNKWVLELPELINVKAKMTSLVNDINKNYLKLQNRLAITTSWFAIEEQNQESQYHIHSNSLWSGIYYFGHSSNLAPLSLMTPYHESIFTLSTENNQWNSREVTYNPILGDFLFFPSNVLHRGEKHTDINKRYALVFNTFPVGTIGSADSTLTIQPWD